MQLDLEDLTLGEIEDLEEATGVNIMAVDMTNPSLKLIRGFAWIMARRENPSMTYEESRGIKLRAIGETPAPNAGGGRNGRGASSATSRPSSTSTAGSRRRRSGV